MSLMPPSATVILFFVRRVLNSVNTVMFYIYYIALNLNVNTFVRGASVDINFLGLTLEAIRSRTIQLSCVIMYVSKWS